MSDLKFCTKHKQNYYMFCSKCLFEPITFCKIELIKSISEDICYCNNCNSIMDSNVEFINHDDSTLILTCPSCGFRTERDFENECE